MPNAIQRRRGTTVEHAVFTGLVGELTVDTVKKTVVVHDGVTAGGFPLVAVGSTASININGTVGATTPAAGAFTNLSATGDISISGANQRLAFSLATGQGGITNNVGSAGIDVFGGSHATKANKLDISAAGGIQLLNNTSYIGTLTGGTGIVNIGSGQIYKTEAGFVGIGTTTPGTNKLYVAGDAVAFISGGGNQNTYIGTSSAADDYAVLHWNTLGNYFSISNQANANTLVVKDGNVLIGTTADAGTGKLQVAGDIAATATIKTGSYTVATLPAGTVGQRAYVTDAAAPTYNGALVGGGTVVIPVFRNATVWVSA